MSDASPGTDAPTLSIRIAVLTYNRALFLEKMLASIVQQTCTDFTCRVFDNGSTDSTPTAVAHYTSRDSRFHSERIEENLPASANFNRAIRWGTGADCFALLHDDDELEPAWLDTLVNALRQQPRAGLAASNARMMLGSSLIGRTFFSRIAGSETFKDHPSFVAWLFKNGALVFPAILYRSSAVGEETLRHAGRASDIMFYMRVTRESGAVLCYAPLLRYRVHAQQDSVGLAEADVVQLDQFLQIHIPAYAPSFTPRIPSFINTHRLVSLRAQARDKPLGTRFRLLASGIGSRRLPLYDPNPRYFARLIMLLLGR